MKLQPIYRLDDLLPTSNELPWVCYNYVNVELQMYVNRTYSVYVTAVAPVCWLNKKHIFLLHVALIPHGIIQSM